MVLACWLCGSAVALASESVVLNQAPVSGIQPMVPADPVAIPETIGASLLAGVGFFMLFRRRRYH